MHPVGIVRKIDLLGRIVVPAEIRRTLSVDIGDPMEIFMDNDKIILRKYSPNCIFCGSDEDMSIIGNRPVCKNCLKDIKKEAAK